MIYFLRHTETGLIKIGKTIGFSVRLSQLMAQHGDGVLLRSQRWVYVPEIDFELSSEQKAALRIIKSAVRIASDTMPEGLWNEFQGLDTESVRNQINRIVSDMMRNYNSLGDRER
jgi:hypothetical protein